MDETRGAPLDSAAFDAVVIAEDVDATAAELAVAQAGGHLVARVAWHDAAAMIGAQARRPVLVVEARGVEDAALDDALPQIAEALHTLELHAVVTFEESQIDRIVGALMGERVELLCAPGAVDQVAALVLAGQAANRFALHDRVSEGEATRLARLNEEVARIADVLARLSRREDRDVTRGDVADRRQRFDAGPAPAAEPIDPALIRGVIRARRLRDKQFGQGLFEDPAWDMMLDLFAAQLERAQVSVSSLCIAAAVAPTTALRWIGRMTEAGLFERQPDPFDRRRAFMALSDRALEGMRGYVATCHAQGLPIA